MRDHLLVVRGPRLMALPVADKENLHYARLGLTSNTARRWMFKAAYLVISHVG